MVPDEVDAADAVPLSDAADVERRVWHDGNTTDAVDDDLPLTADPTDALDVLPAGDEDVASTDATVSNE